MRNFTVLIEQDEDGAYIGSVPALRGCHTQADSMDELMIRMKEAIELCLEVYDERELRIPTFVGLQIVQVAS